MYGGKYAIDTIILLKLSFYDYFISPVTNEVLPSDIYLTIQFISDTLHKMSTFYFILFIYLFSEMFRLYIERENSPRFFL